MHRALVVIPHYFNRAGLGGARHDSGRADGAARRAAALTAVIAGLYDRFGPAYLVARHSQQNCVGLPSPDGMQLDIVVVTCGEHHLLDALGCSRGLYTRVDATGDPQWLGLGAHKVIAQNVGAYDWYCYLEDDVAIEDPLFFRKLRHVYDLFDTRIGPDTLLQPARHPHAGCFFLDGPRAQRFAQSKYCGHAVDLWITPLDTTATWSVMQTFRLYKPAGDSLAFLEVRHLRPAMIGNLRPDGATSFTWRALT